MAIALAQKAAAVSNAVAFSGSNTAGNLLVMTYQGSAVVTGVTDTAGNAWLKAIAIFDGGLLASETWYVLSAASGANTVTVANSFGASFCHVEVSEWSGGTWSLDQTARAGSGSGPANSGSVTTTQAVELLIGNIGNDASASVTWDIGWTSQYSDATAGAGRAGSWASQIVAATGSYHASGTYGSNVDWQALIAAFSVTGGGGGSRSLFLPPTLTGLGGGGSFFSNPLT